MPYHHVAIELTEPQARRAMRGNGIRIKPDQIGHGRLIVHPANKKKIEKAILKKKALTLELSPAELAETALYHMNNMKGSGMEGGSFWSKIWAGLKKGWKFLKDTGIASKLADIAVPAAATFVGAPSAAPAIRSGIKQIAGVGLETDAMPVKRRGRMRKCDRVEALKGSGLYLS